jgi:DNA primase
VLVVEGYFDAIRVAAAGIPWVVAPLGTALAEGQAELLRKLTRNVVLLYDGDAAGLKATFRAADELLRHEMAVQVVTLREGEDPDTFVREKGPAALLAQIAAAIDVFERKIQLLERAGWFSDLKRARAALDRLLPTIRATRDPITRDMYLSRAAQVGNVSKDLLQREADRPEPSPSSPAPRHSSIPTRQRGDSPVQARLTRGFGAERGLITVALRDPSQLDFLVERLDSNDFQDARLREIFSTLVSTEGALPMDEFAARLSAPAAALLESLLAEAGGVLNVAKTVDDCLAVLECRKIRTRSEQIDSLRAAGEGDADALMKEKEQLRDRARELGCMRVYWK